MGLSSSQKCTAGAAMRMLAYALAAEAVDEYLRLGVKPRPEIKFTQGVIDCFWRSIFKKANERRLRYASSGGRATWLPGNDWKHRLYASSFNNTKWDTILRMTFILNGLPSFKGLRFHKPTDKNIFEDHQAAVRKDVEHAFGVLRSRSAIVHKPSLAWDEYILSNIMVACIIMLNMIDEDEPESYIQSSMEFNEDQPRTGASASSSNNANESFEYGSERPFDITKYLAKRDVVRDRTAQISLKNGLIELIWQQYGHKAEQ